MLSDKTGWEGRGQQLRDSRWGRRDCVGQALPGISNDEAFDSVHSART